MGRELTRLIYGITKEEKFVRDFGLKDQIQRASGSIMHNIAEARGKTHNTFSSFIIHNFVPPLPS